jgi:hypothetical protein
MKSIRTILLVALMAAVVLPALAAPAAATFIHTRGLLMSTYPQDIVVFFSAPREHSRTIAVAIVPPWYFVEDLMGFDSVKLTLTLVNSCPRCSHYGKPPDLLGADSNGQLVVQWSNVRMLEEDNGALLLCPVTFVVTYDTSIGYYMLYLSAEATADGAIFRGWDQIPVAVSPG